MKLVFASNADLVLYLHRLDGIMKERGSLRLSSVVENALRFSSGMSTEFIGESRIALRIIANAKDNPLGELEMAYLTAALAQLDAAFDKR